MLEKLFYVLFCLVIASLIFSIVVIIGGVLYLIIDEVLEKVREWREF